MAMRASMGRIAVVWVALGLSAGAVSAAWAAPKVWRARVHFLPAEEPALYVQVNSAGELRMAESAEGLASARRIWARERHASPGTSGELWQ